MKVFIRQQDKISQISATKGENLLAILQSAGFDIAAYCAGNGTCGKCKVWLFDKSFCAKPQEVFACKTIVNSDTYVDLSNVTQYSVKEEDVLQQHKAEGFNRFSQYCFAIDLGTTTIAVALVGLGEKKAVIDNTVIKNPQSVYGADVISRIQACSNGLAFELHTAVIEGINGACKMLFDKHDLRKPIEGYLSGNTVMTHILMAEDCTGIGKAPYMPTFLESRVFELNNSVLTKLITTRCLSSFVGGDIVAALSCLDTAAENKWNMLIDLGTNAEIVLYNEKKYIAASTSAGPCFEGGNISCGGIATDGAIFAVDIFKGSAVPKTIGNKSASSICGTGLFDAVSVMLDLEIIDEGGAFLEGDQFILADGVTINQKDIREFQLAKSAVRTGIEILLDKAGVTEVDSIYIAGGFSKFLRAESVEKCGLLPRGFAQKIVPIGNASLNGSIGIAMGKTIDKIVEAASIVELVNEATFFDKFVENLSF